MAKRTKKEIKRKVKKSPSNKEVKEIIKETPLFVGVPNPDSLRKNLLECSKEFLLILKRIENIKIYQEEKNKLISAISNQLKDVKTLINKLKKNLPSVTIIKSLDVAKKVGMSKKDTDEKDIGTFVSSNEKVSNKKSVIKKSKMTELEKLEYELEMIESKLTNV